MAYFAVTMLVLMILFRFYLGRTLRKPSKNLSPEDNNKDPSKLKNKMDKLYLHYTILSDPNRGIKLDIDHRKEIMAGIDEYISNMNPFIKITANDLILPKEEFAHIGYKFQGDWFDLNGTHLYESKRWVKDLNKYLPLPKYQGFFGKLRRLINA